MAMLCGIVCALVVSRGSVAHRVAETVESDLHAAMSVLEETGAARASFYLYELPNELNTKLADCFHFTHSGVELWHFDDKEMAQNSGELFLYALLKRHPLRITDAALQADPTLEPDLYFIPYYSFLSTFTTEYPTDWDFRGDDKIKAFRGCMRNQDVDDRAVLLHETLTAHRFYTPERMRKHVMMFPFWYIGERAWGKVMKDLAPAGAFLLANDLVFKDGDGILPEGWAKGSEFVAVPYVSNMHAGQSMREACVESKARRRNCFWRGDALRQVRFKSQHGSDRLAIATYLDRCELCGIEGSHKKRWWGPTFKTTPLPRDKAIEAYESGMACSAYCPVMGGDTPTTRRLYDAIYSGCVPLIIDDALARDSDLPFSAVLDWSAFSVTVRQPKHDALRATSACAGIALTHQLKGLYADAAGLAAKRVHLRNARNALAWATLDVSTAEGKAVYHSQTDTPAHGDPFASGAYSPTAIADVMLRELESRLRARGADAVH